MLKKLLCLFLALTLLFSFAACDDKDDDWDDDEDEETLEDRNTTITAPVNFEEQVIAETDQYLVKVKSIDVEENEWASAYYKLTLYFENNTDKTLYFDIDGGVFNDFSVPSYFHLEVPAGKKANETLEYDTYLMDLAGITQITKIIIPLDISYYTEEEGRETVATEQAAIYPEGRSAYSPYVHTPGKNELLFHEDDQFTIRILDVMDDEGGTYGLKIYFYNKTAEAHEIFLNNSAFNDYLMGDGSYWNTRIYPKSHTIHEITWDRNQLEENDIKTVEKIWLKFYFELVSTWENFSIENEFETF